MNAPKLNNQPQFLGFRLFNSKSRLNNKLQKSYRRQSHSLFNFSTTLNKVLFFVEKSYRRQINILFNFEVQLNNQPHYYYYIKKNTLFIYYLNNAFWPISQIFQNNNFEPILNNQLKFLWGVFL